MKKSALFVLVTISTIALCLALIPNVSSQPENVSVLSYSYYVYPYDNNYLIVVGEAQNTGSNVIDYIRVTGILYADDGTAYMISYSNTLLTQILPQQKTPFYIRFSQQDVINGPWGSQGIKNFKITVTHASPTATQQYQDLTITTHSESSDSNSYYVTGTVKNTGSQPTNRTWVVATFYNSTGSVVAVGYSAYLDPDSIPAGGTASFTIYPVDYEAVSASIASYSLAIQTELTAPSATSTPTPSPTSSASATPTPSQSSPSPTPTGSGNGTTIPDTYIYAAVIAVAIVVIVAVALVLRKRAGKRTAIPHEQAE
jgi:hypothetical protein